MPRISVPITSSIRFPWINQCWVHRRGDAQKKNATRVLASSTKMRNNFAIFADELYTLGFLSCRKVDHACFKPGRCRTGIVSEPTVFERIHQLFRYTRISSGVMWCVWSSFANLSISRHISSLQTNVKHVLAELLIADEPVVNTQEISLLAFLLERVRGEVLVIPWLLPVTVPGGSPFLYVVIGNREENHGVLDKFLVLLRSVSQEVPARAIDDADVPV